MPDKNTFDHHALMRALGNLEEADHTDEQATGNAADVVNRQARALLKQAKKDATKKDLGRVIGMNQAIRTADQETFRMLGFGYRKYVDAKREALNTMRRMARDAEYRERAKG